MIRLLPILIALPLVAQETAVGPQRPTIRTSSEAVVTAKPDQARIDIGVIAQAPAAEKAAAQTAAQVDAVIRAIKNVIGPAGEVRTISYSVQPEYTHPREGGRPSIAGYSARNVVQVTTTDLDRVGKLIDAAMAAGANNVQQLQFTLKNPQAVKQLALKQAALEARSSAEAIASALGLRIVRVLAVEESGGGPIRPMMEFAMARSANAPVPTPIETGTIDVQARVSLTVEVAQ